MGPCKNTPPCQISGEGQSGAVNIVNFEKSPKFRKVGGFESTRIDLNLLEITRFRRIRSSRVTREPVLSSSDRPGSRTMPFKSVIFRIFSEFPASSASDLEGFWIFVQNVTHFFYFFSHAKIYPIFIIFKI